MTINEIISYEKMAKLSLNDTERDLLLKRANMLEKSFSKIESTETTGIEPLITVLNMKNVLREDISEQILPREEILANAPEQYDGYFQVPKTLE